MRETAVWARGVIAAGFSGTRFEAALPWFGAYVLFARNVETIEQVRALSDALRARRDDGAPPALAIDQEGGRVARLREGVEPMPSMMALGAVDDLELTRRAGEQTAFDLRRAGCTVDLAPVLDLARQAGNTVIGTRSLGSDPQRVAALGAAFCAGLQAGGIAPCPKHFPGHGATAVDSHTALPVIESDAAELRARDLIPFGALARSVPAMMGAHVLAPAFDPDAPATRSAPAISLLRRELGFEGAFVTDCLQMSALEPYGDVSDNAIASLKSGADLLIVSHDPALALKVAAAIESAVDKGKLAAQRLEEAYRRVLRLRTAACADSVALDAFAPHPGVGREIARRAVTLIRGLARLDPTVATVVSFEGTAIEGVNVSGGARASLTTEAPALHEVRLPLDPPRADLESALRELIERRLRPLVLARRAHLHPAQAQAVETIVRAYPDAVVVSALEPYDLPLFDRAQTLLATYGDDRAAIGGLADVLFGGSFPEGRLPVRLQL